MNKSECVSLDRQSHYETLQVAQNASVLEIKAAYHRVLLSSHPDKAPRSSLQGPKDTSNGFDISRLQDAYRTLSNPASRAVYDALLAGLPSNGTSTPTSGPRPAQIISLEEFDQLQQEDNEQDLWSHPCRCGGRYTISETQMENDQHVVACEQCSEAIYVGYEVMEEADESG